MDIDTINSAILAHQTWVGRFQTAVKGINTETFDIGQANDDTACSLGRWLRSESSLTLLGQDSHHQIMVIHATFHEIAGNIATRLNHHESGEGIEELLAEFSSLSRQLVMLLMHTKR